jgi:hypothetical protein
MPTRLPGCSARLTLFLVMAMFSRLSFAQSALPVYTVDNRDHVIGSTYIPVDNWVYDSMDRLQALGYVDSAFLGIRPWTRASVLAMLAETAPKLEDSPGDDEAREIYLALERELKPSGEPAPTYFKPHTTLESAYVRALGIGGQPLRDSFHLGQTIASDYARPYQQGFNPIAGFSARSQAGRFSLYVRAEYQHAPAASGYSPALAATLSGIDLVPFSSNPVQATIHKARSTPRITSVSSKQTLDIRYGDI